jgi:hypothetical protein
VDSQRSKRQTNADAAHHEEAVRHALIVFIHGHGQETKCDGNETRADNDGNFRLFGGVLALDVVPQRRTHVYLAKIFNGLYGYYGAHSL